LVNVTEAPERLAPGLIGGESTLAQLTLRLLEMKTNLGVHVGIN
jgi:hypothetical protein